MHTDPTSARPPVPPLHDVPLPTGGVAGFAVDIDELEQARGGIKRFGEAQRAMLALVAKCKKPTADELQEFCKERLVVLVELQQCGGCRQPARRRGGCRCCRCSARRVV